MERTAVFISQQGQQMEIIIKTKQRFNPSFSFLHHEDRLFPYYKHLLHSLTNGTYEPQVAMATDNNDNDTGDKNGEMEPSTTEHVTKLEPGGTEATPTPVVGAEEDSDSDGEFELHPILRANLDSLKTKKQQPDKTDSDPEPDSGSIPTDTDSSKFKPRTFKSIAYTINSAPNVSQDTQLTNGTTNPSITTANQ